MRAYGRLWVWCRLSEIDKVRCRLRDIDRVMVRVRVMSQVTPDTDPTAEQLSP